MADGFEASLLIHHLRLSSLRLITCLDYLRTGCFGQLVAGLQGTFGLAQWLLMLVLVVASA